MIGNRFNLCAGSCRFHPVYGKLELQSGPFLPLRCPPSVTCTGNRPSWIALSSRRYRESCSLSKGIQMYWLIYRFYFFKVTLINSNWLPFADTSQRLDETALDIQTVKKELESKSEMDKCYTIRTLNLKCTFSWILQVLSATSQNLAKTMVTIWILSTTNLEGTEFKRKKFILWQLKKLCDW